MRTPERACADEGDVALEFGMLGNGGLGFHQRKSTRMFFFKTAHAGFGDHEREFFDTKIATDVADEVRHVAFVGRVLLDRRIRFLAERIRNLPRARRSKIYREALCRHSCDYSSIMIDHQISFVASLNNSITSAITTFLHQNRVEA